MKTRFIHFVFLMSGLFSFSQAAVEILEEETTNHMVFKAKNTLDEPVEITFELSEVRGLEHDGQPIVKLVGPEKTVLVAELKKIGGPISYVYGYNQVLMPAKIYDPEDFKKFEQGIVVFSRDGCTRCAYATDYLVQNKVDFTLLNFTQLPEYGAYMWDKLREQGVIGNQVGTPVIMVNGRLSHSHENLKQFVKTLKQSQRGGK
jgi:glutaredoxin